MLDDFYDFKCWLITIAVIAGACIFAFLFTGIILAISGITEHPFVLSAVAAVIDGIYIYQHKN